jgi:transposase
MDKSLQTEIRELKERGMKIRAISRKLGIDRKTVRRALGVTNAPPSPEKKLEPFLPLVRQLAEKQLTGPRILREIRERGYQGSRTILLEHLKTLRGTTKNKPPRVVRRFETGPGVESQSDWSPFRVRLAGIETVVHCFTLILAFSRRLFAAFYRNERLPTLLFAHGEAFRYDNGLTSRVVYDNQAAITLGRVGGKPLFNPTFLEFTRHHGYTPWLCRPRDPKRKGKIENPYRYIESDFLRGSEFASLEDLNARVRTWLDTVANVRRHGTTGRPIDEAYEEERPFLISLPSVPFATERVEVRKVAADGAVCIDGTFYPVPATLIGQHVTSRVSPVRVEILDRYGRVVVAHRVPERPGRIPREEGPPAPPAVVSLPVLEVRFLARFPGATAFLAGLRRRMKALTPIHLREIDRLAGIYGDETVALALRHAGDYGNYNAAAVRRILEISHPLVVPEPEAVIPDPAALGALDDVESGSPDDWTFDTDPPTDGGDHDQEA